MPVTSRLVAATLSFAGLLGCLSSFGPDLRPRGVHTELPAQSPNATCMGCHESEADALARMHAEGSSPASMSESGPPLVADWMVEESRACVHCHRIRG